MQHLTLLCKCLIKVLCFRRCNYTLVHWLENVCCVQCKYNINENQECGHYQEPIKTFRIVLGSTAPLHLGNKRFRVYNVPISPKPFCWTSRSLEDIPSKCLLQYENSRKDLKKKTLFCCFVSYLYNTCMFGHTFPR